MPGSWPESEVAAESQVAAKSKATAKPKVADKSKVLDGDCYKLEFAADRIRVTDKRQATVLVVKRSGDTLSMDKEKVDLKKKKIVFTRPKGKVCVQLRKSLLSYDIKGPEVSWIYQPPDKFTLSGDIQEGGRTVADVFDWSKRGSSSGAFRVVFRRKMSSEECQIALRAALVIEVLCP